MTGFGRGEATGGEGRLVRVEIASVNRKQSDIAVLLPRDLLELEVAVRKRIAPRVSRGRVTVKVEVDDGADGGQSLRVDWELARAYREALGALAKAEGVAAPAITAGDYLAAEGVFTLQGGRLEAGSLWAAVEEAATLALDGWDAMRQAEGVALEEDLRARVGALQEHVEAVRRLAPDTVVAARQNLHRRLREAGLDLDIEDDRVLKEVALYAERCDVSEELTRLESHLQQLVRYLECGEPVGRALDFLAQEMNREINTIGAKASNAAIALHVVEGKAEVEKIREQVQNVE